MKPLYAVIMFATLIVSSSFGAGCSDDPRSCEIDDDCFGGEACVAGVCQSQSASNDADPNNDPNDTGANNNTSDADSNNDLNDADPNDAGNDVTSEDTGDDPDANEGHTDTCEVDPFTVTCNNDDDYDNDEWIDADKLMEEGSLGCAGGLERPDAWARRIEGKICYDETGDFYRTQVVPCDSQFRVEVKLTVPEICTAEEFALNASFNGGSPIDCNTEKDFFSAQCEREGNVHTWTLLIKPYGSIWSLYFSAVGSDNEDLSSQFDYTLDAQIL